MRKEKSCMRLKMREKRKIAEEHAKRSVMKPRNAKNKQRKPHTLLSRIIKRRVGTKRSVKTKGSYSRQWKAKQKQQLTNEVNVTWDFLIIIIIIKICSAHISTLLGAQGAETEKTWIQTIYSDTTVAKTKLWDTCTMQLQIYIIFEKLWHKMSFKQRLKSSYTMTRFDFSWKMIPESRSRDFFLNIRKHT